MRGGGGLIFESNVDYARGKKHNVVVKGVDAMAFVEIRVAAIVDDLNNCFAWDVSAS